jgi:FKBP-type peptidyl-prolyl cis-trans isomerase 2|tara:strand:+ start:845 stop:1267 length:423 start_codon:yes stop_codon:yes gene_type:complete
MVVKKGDKIKVDYTGSLEDGKVFDSSEKHGQPLEFVAGEGVVVKGFDAAVIGMDVGEEKTVTLKPEDAYGESNPQAIQKVPKDKFPAEAKEGMMIGVPLANGQQIPARITKIGRTEVTLDMNHLLCGKTLVFKIKIVSIE